MSGVVHVREYPNTCGASHDVRDHLLCNAPFEYGMRWVWLDTATRAHAAHRLGELVSCVDCSAQVRAIVRTWQCIAGSADPCGNDTCPAHGVRRVRIPVGA